MITIPTKSANYDPEIIKFFHNLYIFALEINYFPVLLSVCALLAGSPKRNKRKVVSGSRVTLPENFAYKPGLSFNPLARVTLAVGLPYLLVNRALIPKRNLHTKVNTTNRPFATVGHVTCFSRTH